MFLSDGAMPEGNYLRIGMGMEKESKEIPLWSDERTSYIFWLSPMSPGRYRLENAWERYKDRETPDMMS